MVHLVEIDAVGPETFEALITGTADVMGRQAGIVRTPAHPSVDLGGQDDLLAAAPTLRQPAADDLLGHSLAGAPAVDVGGVEEGDAVLQCNVHDREAVVLARERPEVHGAEAETADPQSGAAEVHVFHGPALDQMRAPSW